MHRRCSGLQVKDDRDAKPFLVELLRGGTATHGTCSYYHEHELARAPASEGVRLGSGHAGAFRDQ
jgi:hypothetical protein